MLSFKLDRLSKGLWQKKLVKPFSRVFPHDILCIIVSLVALDSRQDLESLSLVNRQFLGISCGSIWSAFTLAVKPGQSVKANKLNEEKLNILLRRATQGRVFNELLIRLEADLLDGHHRSGFRTRLQLLTQEVSQLQSLALIDASRFMNLNDLVVADFAHHRFQLVELYCKLTPTPGLCDFLVSQPTIRRLSLVPITNTVYHALIENLPPDALPNLEAALGDIRSLRVLRTGRAVRYIAVVPAVRSEHLEELWNTVSLPLSHCPLEALSVTLDRPDAFMSFFPRLPIHAPALHFLGIAIVSEYATFWTVPGPTNGDIPPLRNLTKLETIRWEFCPVDSSGINFDSGHIVYVRAWRASDYAGPSLRYVQHEIGFSYTEPWIAEAHEGRQERRDLEGNEWGPWPKLLFPPRREGKLPSRESMDPIALEYLQPTPYIPRSGSVFTD